VQPLSIPLDEAQKGRVALWRHDKVVYRDPPQRGELSLEIRQIL
jgi:hypothetical protein